MTSRAREIAVMDPGELGGLIARLPEGHPDLTLARAELGRRQEQRDAVTMVTIRLADLDTLIANAYAGMSLDQLASPDHELLARVKAAAEEADR